MKPDLGQLMLWFMQGFVVVILMMILAGLVAFMIEVAA